VSKSLKFNFCRHVEYIKRIIVLQRITVLGFKESHYMPTKADDESEENVVGINDGKDKPRKR